MHLTLGGPLVRIKILQALESFFQGLETMAGKMRERVAVCPDCGRNRYTGQPCVKSGV